MTILNRQCRDTMTGCTPSLMDQEKRFLDVRRNVRRFELSVDGALLLQTGDGRTITARR